MGQNASSFDWLNIAAKNREYFYSRINNQLFHERGEILWEQNVSPTKHITVTQELLALRPLDPTAPSKMLELKHLDTKVMVYMTLLQGRVVVEAVQ